MARSGRMDKAGLLCLLLSLVTTFHTILCQNTTENTFSTDGTIVNTTEASTAKTTTLVPTANTFKPGIIYKHRTFR